MNDHPDYQDWTPQNGRFQAFKNAKKHLCAVFNFKNSQKPVLKSKLEDLLQYSYGILHQKANEVIQNELNKSIHSCMNDDYSRFETYKNRGKSYNLIPKQEEASHSMMLVSKSEKDRFLMNPDPEIIQHSRNSFENSSMSKSESLQRMSQKDSQDQISVQRDTSIINQVPKSQVSKFTTDLMRESMRKGSPVDARILESNPNIDMTKFIPQQYPTK